MEDYFQWGLMRELTTPSEWVFALAILVLAYHWYSNSMVPAVRIAAVSGVPAILLLITER
jgi:hypothetical protein